MREYLKTYAGHYFNLKNAGSFLLVSFIGLVGVIAIILIIARTQTKYHGKKDIVSMDTQQINLVRNVHYSLIESFYEMVFATTSVLIFLSLYYLLDGYYGYSETISYYWSQYKDILLLVFILFSVVLTNWMDVAFVHLRHLDPDRKATIRLVSSLYIIVILLYIKYIYKSPNYDQLIMYFLLLGVGRFLYFDTTLKWLGEIFSSIIKELPLVGLMGLYTAITCWYGFKTGFLLTSNGVIVSTLIAHLFMDLAILLLHITGMLHLFMPKTDDPLRHTAKRTRAKSMTRPAQKQTLRNAAGNDIERRAEMRTNPKYQGNRQSAQNRPLNASEQSYQPVQNRPLSAAEQNRQTMQNRPSRQENANRPLTQQRKNQKPAAGKQVNQPLSQYEEGLQSTLDDLTWKSGQTEQAHSETHSYTIDDFEDM